MKKIPLFLSEMQEVLNFVNIINDFEHNCDLCCGRYCVDAKSLLGVITLQGVSNVELIIHTEEADDMERIIMEKISGKMS